MKRLSYFLIVLLTLVSLNSTAFAQNNNNNKKEIRRALAAEQEKADFELAKQALIDQKFVIEADQLQLPDGLVINVSSTINFISMNKDKVSVQIAANQYRPMQNGIGGFTVDGSISNLETKTTKKGLFIMKFNVMGVAISAMVDIQMTGGGNKVTAKIYPNFNSNTLTMTGRVIPLEQSTVYKGRSI
ncbi:MAG: DUF4251 domain-containing protein [Bacteroidales bacterium]